jgi:hypothetical protein
VRPATRALGIGIAVVVSLTARDAAAHEVVQNAVVAVTDDGVYEAVYTSREENLEPGTCGMRKAGTRALLVHAECGAAPTAEDSTSTDVLPFEKWQWINPTPTVRRLRKFDDAGIDKVVRTNRDGETRVDYAEVFHGGSWLRVRFFDDDDRGGLPKVTGVIKGRDRYLFRLAYEHDVDFWDKVWALTFAEVADEKGQYERALKEAQDDTARMREHRKQGDAVFAPPPAGTRKEKWEQRRRQASRASCASGRSSGRCVRCPRPI